jgi:lipid A ethanolaminephosphotransferase
MFLKSIRSKKSSFLSNKEPGIHPSWLIIVSSLWLASIGNLALWQELTRLPEMNDWRAVWFGIAFAALIASLLCMLMSLLCWRWTLKPVIALFLTSAAFGAYFMLSYRVVIDSSMMVNVLQTDLRESLDLFSWKLVVTVLFLAVLPIVVLWKLQVNRLTVLKTLAGNVQLFLASCVVAAVAVFPVYQDFASSMRNHIQLRYLINPLNSFYGLAQLAVPSLKNPTGTLQTIGDDAKLGPMYTNQPKIPLLVLVIGETARSGNFGINGYDRDTTPLLKAIKKNTDQSGELTTQSDAWSCGTTTATSLPCMFSHLGKSAYENKQADYENLIDVLNKAGLAVIWLENQSGCKGICDRVYRAATQNSKDPELCSTGECFDEIMLKNLDIRLQEVPYDKLSRGAVIVMHQMGSHGPAYYKRSPEVLKKFKPECTNNALQECTRTEVVNAYDNSIVYTDYFLSKVISMLKSKAATLQGGMLYVSDHGESLGENNLYLHGLPYAIAPYVQKHVPWISWFANDFIGRHNLDTDCLESRAGKKLSHDNYFHTVLGLMDIQTEVYKTDLDAYAPCRLKQTQTAK